MDLPFTIDQFLEVFKQYNLTVWPFQIFLNLLAVTAVVFAFRKISSADRIISTVLGFLWLWTGIVYHLLFFTEINKPAYIFGMVFILQGMLFLYAGTIKDRLSFKFSRDIYSISGLIFILYALILYPILGYFFGHVYPEQPTFGAPCPTTIFTFGLLLLTDRTFSKYILIIPVLWSLIGFSAAVNLGIYEDFGLVIAGILGLILIILRDKNRRASTDAGSKN
jgi:hypothetical protein